MNTTTAIVIGVISTILLIVSLIGLIGHLRLEKKREEARMIRPTPGEVWLQDDVPLVIKNVAKHGITLVMEADGQLETWLDTWLEWRKRLEDRVVIRTNQRVQ